MRYNIVKQSRRTLNDNNLIKTGSDAVEIM